jgi:hypothetical protein
MSLITGAAAAASTAALNTQELPNLMRQWMRTQEEMNTLNAEIRQRRTQAKALRDVILRIMETNNLAQLNISKGAVIHETREIKGGMSADYIARHCKDFFNGDEAKASALVAYLNEHRETKVKHDLKLRPVASETGSQTSR